MWHIKSTLSSNFLTLCVTNQANCITVSSHFPTMSVTYQVNYLVKVSDNVCDVSSQPYHPIFWQCVLQIRQTVSLYHLIFWQCLWHIRWTTLSNFLPMCVTYQDNCITVSSNFPTMTYQANHLSNSLTMFATYHGDCITVLSHFPTMSKTYQANYLVKYSDNVC